MKFNALSVCSLQMCAKTAHIVIKYSNILLIYSEYILNSQGKCRYAHFFLFVSFIYIYKKRIKDL